MYSIWFELVDWKTRTVDWNTVQLTFILTFFAWYASDTRFICAIFEYYLLYTDTYYISIPVYVEDDRKMYFDMHLTFSAYQLIANIMAVTLSVTKWLLVFLVSIYLLYDQGKFSWITAVWCPLSRQSVSKFLKCSIIKVTANGCSATKEKL